MNNIKKIFKREKNFFSDYFKRKKNYSIYLKTKYRLETVYKRKLRVSYELCRIFKNKIKYGPYKGTKFSIEENSKIKFSEKCENSKSHQNGKDAKKLIFSCYQNKN